MGPVAASLVCLLALALAGCGTANRERDAGAVAQRFHAALESGDGRAACHELTEATSSKLAQQEQKPCEEAIPQPARASASKHTSEAAAGLTQAIMPRCARSANRVGLSAVMGSLWFDHTTRPQREALEHDVSVDVAVLGAGIVGLTTALMLEREGASVAVIEARRVAAGASGYNTAKLSSLHGLSYRKLVRSLGSELARAYGEANEAGIARVFELAGELGIDCDLRRKPNYTYTESESDLEHVREEAGVALGLGLPASFVKDVDLPFAVAGAVRFDEQAEFHPVKYLEGLAAALDGAVYEGTMATHVHGGRVRTAGGQVVNAENVVVATHLPFLDRGLYFARCHPERSYVVAGRTGDAPAGMYLSTEQPRIRSGRTASGCSWEARATRPGRPTPPSATCASRRGRASASASSPSCAGRPRTTCRWTAFPSWGATTRSRRACGSRPASASGARNGHGGCELLAAQIAGRDHAWAELFDPQRVRPKASAASFVKENANVALRFFGDRVAKRGDVGRDRAGRGACGGVGVGQRAVYRDDEGGLHELSARCTHLGCIVNGTRASAPGTAPATARASRPPARSSRGRRSGRSRVLEPAALGRDLEHHLGVALDVRVRQRHLIARALEHEVDLGVAERQPCDLDPAQPARQRRPYDRKPLVKRVGAQAEPHFSRKGIEPAAQACGGRHRVGHGLVELRAREAREQLRQAVVVEARGRIEQPLEDQREVLVEAVAAQPEGDQRAVVRPDRAGVVAHGVVGRMARRQRSHAPAGEHLV